MIRFLFFALALGTWPLLADEGVPLTINIVSPDTAKTFAFGTIKNRALIWSDSSKTLSAEVTFEDEQPGTSQSSVDTQSFRLPGITFNKEKGVFYAISATGEEIPIARRKKVFLFSSIEVLPNAIVRVYHRHGNVSVTLEAIRPDDLAKVKQQQQVGSEHSDGTHSISLQGLLP